MPPCTWIERSQASDGVLGAERLGGGDGDGRLLVVLGDAPGGPVGERAGELGLDVRVGERVRDGLVGADLLPELLPRPTTYSTPSSSAFCATPTASSASAASSRRRTGSKCRLSDARAVLDARRPSGRVSSIVSRVSPSAATDVTSSRSTMSTASRWGTSPSTSTDQALLVDLRQRGEDDRGRQERAGVERAAGLLEEDRLVDEREPAAAALLRDRDAEPAELAQLRERRVGVRLQERARLAPQLLLLLGERELHQRDLGRPSTRSAMMLRRISEVPASIVLPRERSCWCCQ